MLITEIHTGKCYLNNIGRHALVRKVIAIKDDMITYKFISTHKRHLLNSTNTVKLANFARWAQEPIEELKDYSHLLGFIRQKNYKVLSVSGKPLLSCQEKKLKFYVKKNLIRQIDENTFQFTTDEIEKNLLAIHDGDIPTYVNTPKNECCVVCGAIHNLTKHHVVPKKDLSHYSIKLKSILSNKLTICRKHHTAYEENKLNYHPIGYTLETILGWSDHFMRTMNPKFMPDGWNIISCKIK